jgi:hypothetical protein
MAVDAVVAVESGPRSVFEQPIIVVHTITEIQAALQRMKASWKEKKSHASGVRSRGAISLSLHAASVYTHEHSHWR